MKNNISVFYKERCKLLPALRKEPRAGLTALGQICLLLMRSIMLLASMRSAKRPSLVLTIWTAALSAVLLVQQVNAQEDGSLRSGQYELFYSAFNSSFLQPETAVAINVKRAKNIALINLSVREHLADGSTKEVRAAAVKATAFNLVHKNTLEFQEVVEPGAIYYLAKFKINNDNEMIVINASITPEGSDKAIELEFRQQFYLN